jgi:HD-GYP domain-containing protein (c-di-GMP phosphodiesterase class II)
MKPAAQRGASMDIALVEQPSDETPGSFLEAVLGSLRVKDHYTFEHGGSVRDLAVEVGRSIRLRSLNLWRLSEAAFFHDIGKVCIPSEILQKAGPLTSTEKRVMERHPELGQRLLEHVPGYEEVAHIVRGCHENFDGSGYPDGLAGDEIPMEARIISVVDAYDAITARRAYKDEVPAAEARMGIAAVAGTRFDPHVVRAFLGIFPEDQEGA